MEDVHLTSDLLDAVLSGEQSPADLVPLVLGHLFSFCPTCEKAFREWKGNDSEVPPLYHAETTELVQTRAIQMLDLVREQESAARILTEEILSRPPEERLTLLRQAPPEERGPALAKSLIEAARGSLPGNPQESLARARLARTLLQHADLSPYVAELYARAVAYVANGLRILGSLSEAAEMMAHARFLLRYERGGDRLVRAELDNLEGVVRLHQRQYEDAERLLERAIQSYRFAGMELEALRSSLWLAILYQNALDLDACIRIQREVVEGLELWDEPQLQLFARHNLALFLCDAGEYDEARELLEVNRAIVSSSGNPIMLLRFSWVEGLLERGLGNLDAAESHFIVARHGFVKSGLSFDAVLVSLDLAGVYLEQQRLMEVKSLASEAVQAFEAQERYTEAFAALTLFRAAAEMDRVTTDLIRDLVIYLRRSSLDSAYCFRASRTKPSLPWSESLPVT